MYVITETAKILLQNASHNKDCEGLYEQVEDTEHDKRPVYKQLNDSHLLYYGKAGILSKAWLVSRELGSSKAIIKAKDPAHSPGNVSTRWEEYGEKWMPSPHLTVQQAGQY